MKNKQVFVWSLAWLQHQIDPGSAAPMGMVGEQLSVGLNISPLPSPPRLLVRRDPGQWLEKVAWVLASSLPELK